MPLIILQKRFSQFLGYSAPQITTPFLPGVTVGSGYSVQMTAAGGLAPYTWSIASDTGSGLIITPAGVLSGTPGTVGTFTLAIQVTDSARVSAQSVFTLTVSLLSLLPTNTILSSWVPDAPLIQSAGMIAASLPAPSQPVPSQSANVRIVMQAWDAPPDRAQGDVRRVPITPAATGFNPPYPRLIGARVAGQANGVCAIGSAFWNWSKYLCVNVVTDSYPGASSIFSSSADAWVQAYHAASLVAGGSKILNYADLAQDTSPTKTVNLPGFNNYVSTLNNWDLYASGTAGTKITNGGFYVPNQSTSTPRDANGWLCAEWEAVYFFQNNVTNSGPYASGSFSWNTGGNDASMHWDGFNWDDRWYVPPSGGDVARLGSPDSNLSKCVSYNASSPTSTEALAETWRAGQVAAFNKMDALFAAAGLAAPFRFGNNNSIGQMLYHYNDGFPHPGSASIAAGDPAVFGSFNQALDGCDIQGFLGWGYSEGLFGQNLSNVLNILIPCYTLQRKGLRGPQIVEVDCYNVQSDGRIPATWSGANPATWTPAFGASNPTGGNGMRYYLAFTCMQSGGISWTAGTGLTNGTYSTDLTTFDEMGNNGCVDCPPGYLGYPALNSRGAIQTTRTYANGIFEREFVNPTTGRTWRVAMNPRGNGPQTYIPQTNGVNITVHRINGSQNPTYNTGATVAAGAGIPMADPDGVFVYL